MDEREMFCPYHIPHTIPCPPATTESGRTCRALQEDGICLRLEADRALVRLSRCACDGGFYVYMKEAQ